MTPAWFAIVVLLFSTATAAAVSSAVLLLRREGLTATAAPLATLLGSAAAWMSAYLGHLVNPTANWALSLLNLQAAAAGAAITATVVYVARLTGHGHWFRGNTSFTLAVMVLLVVGVARWNPHHLFRSRDAIARNLGGDGPLYHALLLWLLLLLLLAAAMLLRPGRELPGGRTLPVGITVVLGMAAAAAMLPDQGLTIFGVGTRQWGILMVTALACSAALRPRQPALEAAAHSEFVEHLEDGVVVLDHADRIAGLNRRAVELLGITAHDPLGLELLPSVPDARAWGDALIRSSSGIEVRNADGSTRHVRVERLPLRDDTGIGLGAALLLQDVTEVHTDPLTGVGNRRCFNDSAAELVDASVHGQRAVHVLAIDLDHLKQVNDERGHLTGDAALVECASVLRRAIRTGDRLVRLGGDEFVALLIGLEAEQALQVAERMRMGVEALGYGITLSIGVAPVNEEGSLPRGLAQADDALYIAKRSGRNRICVADPD